MASQRQISLGYGAVRALSAFGNGALGVNSRPTTPVSDPSQPIIAQKLGKVMAERQSLSALRQKPAFMTTDESDKTSHNDDWVTLLPQQNGRNEFSCQEDQEVKNKEFFFFKYNFLVILLV